MRALAVIVLLLGCVAGAFAVSANTRSHLRSALTARMELWAVNTGSCQDSCGGKSLDGSCWCDPGCSQPDFQDCCADYLDACSNPPAFPPEFKAEWDVNPDEQNDATLSNDASADLDGSEVTITDSHGKKYKFDVLTPEEYFAEKQDEWDHVFSQMNSGNCGNGYGYGYDGYGYDYSYSYGYSYGYDYSYSYGYDGYGYDYSYGYNNQCELSREVTCDGHCGKFLYYCGCDDLCVYFKDCCHEFVSNCPNEADSGLDKYLGNDREAPSLLQMGESRVSSLRQMHREEAMQRRARA